MSSIGRQRLPSTGKLVRGPVDDEASVTVSSVGPDA